MKTFIIASLALLLTTATSFAQSATNNAQGAADSRSSSGASVVLNSGRSYRSTGGAFAPGLTASGLSCNGSVSSGVGGPGWAVALGGTVKDRDCNARENTKIANGLGGIKLAKQVACNIPDIREAYRLVGEPCLVDQQRTSTVGTPSRTFTPGKPIKASSNTKLAACQKRAASDPSVKCRVYQ